MRTREAVPEEASLLTQLAFESKSYWGYDQGYLEAAREYMNITEQVIQDNHVYVIEQEEDVIGFYELTEIGTEHELVWFFIHPQRIGQGVGKILWNHLLKTVKELGISGFIIKSDIHAEAFYLKQGAVRIGYKPSAINETMLLPLLKFVVSNS